MIFRINKKKEADKSSWHLWFAWFPVKVSDMNNPHQNTYVWLQNVLRRQKEAKRTAPSPYGVNIVTIHRYEYEIDMGKLK